MSLSFDPQVLEVQRKVVIEEFKQRYLNQPYGDVMLQLRPLAYKKHPYRWNTIGKDISHIENATLDDVKAFFYKFYIPNNAIMVVAGNVDYDEVKRLSEKWFGPIPSGNDYVRQLPAEPPQNEQRLLEMEASVPLDALYKAYHIPGRLHPDYHTADLLSDILGRSKSSRLYQQLVKEEKIFSAINAYISGSIDPGLLIITGKVNNNVSLEQADEAVSAVVHSLASSQIDEDELAKVKNQAESTLVFSEVELLNRAMNLAYGALLGNPDLVNEEPEKIQQVSVDDMKRVGSNILTAENSNTVYYRAKK